MTIANKQTVVKANKVVTKQKTKINTEASYFALKVGLNNNNKERKHNKEFIKSFILLKINKWGVLLQSGG